MPGPLSAPNGNGHLCNRTPKDNERVNTGKTDLKRGKIKHVRKRSYVTRAERERQEES